MPRLQVQTPEAGVAERERKGDITQGRMDRSGGGALHGILCCASIAFSSRSEWGVICMTDDDFVRVVGDEREEKN